MLCGVIHRLRSIAVALLAAPVVSQDDPSEFFGLDRIWDIHIRVAKSDWAGLIPERGHSATEMFGKFPYRRADVTIGAHTLKNVGLRMKGNATFAATGGTLKRSLKFDFDRFESGQRFLGMGKLNLQCNALDGTQIKEAVSYEVYRSCGIVAGRTAFGRVFLTMEGELDDAYIGLYTLVEQVDQRFLKRHLGGGLILKPNGETLGYYGPTWNDAYEESYHPKSEPTDELTRAVIETAALFDEPDDAVFAAGIEAVMDVESFLTYTAATAILINTDSPLTVPDNYYLVVPKKTKKVTWVPWDMNWSMGEYGRVSRTPHLELSVLDPTKKEIFHRVLSIPKFRDRYREIVTKYIDGPCSAESMIEAIRRADATVAQARADEAKREKAVTEASEALSGRRMNHPWLRGRDGDDVDGLVAFARAREKSVREQLAGKTAGKPAHNLFGPNERTVRGAVVRDVLAAGIDIETDRPPLDRAQVAGTIAASFAGIDADSSGSLSASEVTDALRRSRSPGRRPRRDRSPERAARAIRIADRDSDGAISSEEWQKGIQAMLRFWDRDQDGKWSPRELGKRG